MVAFKAMTAEQGLNSCAYASTAAAKRLTAATAAAAAASAYAIHSPAQP